MGEKLGKLISYFRRTSGLSETALAQQTGMNRSYLNRVEKGKKAGLNAENAVRLAQILNIPQENMAEFLLQAAGYSDQQVESALATITKSELPEEIILQRNDGRWKIRD